MLRLLFILFWGIEISINAQNMIDSSNNKKPSLFFSLEASNNLQNVIFHNGKGIWFEVGTRFVIPRDNKKTIGLGVAIGYNGFYGANFPTIEKYNCEGYYFRANIAWKMSEEVPLWLSLGPTISFYNEFGSIKKFKGNIFEDYLIPLQKTTIALGFNLNFFVYLKIYKNFYIEPLIGITPYIYFSFNKDPNLLVNTRSYFIPGIGHATFLSSALKAQVSLVYKLDLNPKKRK